jgi:hypothetical protein
MKLSINQNGSFQMEHVYLPVTLVTDDKEEMSIIMRDSGFEFNYQGVWYSAKNGFVEMLGSGYNGEEQKRLLRDLASEIKQSQV